MADMVPVRFIKPSLPYAAGEIAWFGEIQAAAYVKQGFAERAPAKTSGDFVPAITRAERIEAEERERQEALRRAAAA